MKGSRLKILIGILMSVILVVGATPISAKAKDTTHKGAEIGRASCRERV